MCICNYEKKNMRKEEKVEKGEQRDCKSICDGSANRIDHVSTASCMWLDWVMARRKI